MSWKNRIPGASHLHVGPTLLNLHHPLLKQLTSSPSMPSDVLHNVIIHCTRVVLSASDSFAVNFLVALLGEKFINHFLLNSALGFGLLMFRLLELLPALLTYRAATGFSAVKSQRLSPVSQNNNCLLTC